MGHFITLEGSEGSGKSTQFRLLQTYLASRGVRVLATREPGGTSIGEQIRAVLHDVGNDALRPRAEVLLYAAARAQLVEQVIRPALAAGTVVICDRYVESTLAYQGYGRGLDLAALLEITRFATGGLRADQVIYLDLPVEVGLERKRLAHEREHAEITRMDQQALEFYRRVRAGYLALAAQEPERWCVLDAQQSIEAVQAQIRQCVAALLASGGDVRS
ncbi:MAG TPA: dTMP kinase [Anaerolineae bacterium]|nr:dTMP kinase [Anaerolineae bacterium]HPL26753.1 dTMP kinase [Anaerolineae bacterium]